MCCRSCLEGWHFWVRINIFSALFFFSVRISRFFCFFFFSVRISRFFCSFFLQCKNFKIFLFFFFCVRIWSISVRSFSWQVYYYIVCSFFLIGKIVITFLLVFLNPGKILITFLLAFSSWLEIINFLVIFYGKKEFNNYLVFFIFITTNQSWARNKFLASRQRQCDNVI